MNYVDYVLLLILAYFIFKGARRGFVATIGSFIGIFLGAWAAGRYYDTLAQWLIEHFGLQIMMAIVVSFIGIYLGINFVLGIVIAIITKVFKFIPLATMANRLVGGVLGAVEGMLLVGLVIWIVNLMPFNTSFTEKVKDSQVAGAFESSTQLVQPLLPKSLREFDFNFLQDLQNFTDEKSQYIQQFLPKLFEGFKQQHEQLQQNADEKIESTTETGP